jgi:hypothetical protein
VPEISAEVPGNVGLDWRIGDTAAVDASQRRREPFAPESLAA